MEKLDVGQQKLLDKLRPYINTDGDGVNIDNVMDVLDDLLPGIVGDAVRPVSEYAEHLGQAFDYVCMPQVERAEISDDQLDLSLRSPVFMLIGRPMATMLETARAKNYVELLLKRPGDERSISIEARYINRPSAHECLIRASVENQQLRELLRTARDDYEFLRDLQGSLKVEVLDQRVAAIEQALRGDPDMPRLIGVHRGLLQRISEVIQDAGIKEEIDMTLRYDDETAGT